MMLYVDVLCTILTLCILSQCYAHLVIVVQGDCFCDFHFKLIDESLDSYYFYCQMFQGYIFGFRG